MRNINIFKSITIASALTSVIIGCSKECENINVPPVAQQGNAITLTADCCDVPVTKVAYGEGEGKLNVLWQTNDAFRLYSGEIAPTGNFTLVAADNQKSIGSFEGVAAAGTFNAFFPALSDNTTWSAINASYENQEQDGINSTTHLAAFNYMVAKDIIIADNHPTSNFSFTHLGSVMQFDITLPEDYKPDTDGQPVELVFSSPTMVKSVKPSGEVGDAASALTLKLKNIVLTPTSRTFTAYMMCAPFDIPVNGSVKISLACKVGSAVNTTTTYYEFDKTYAAGKTYVAGKRYKFEALGTTNKFAQRKKITLSGIDFNFVMVRAGSFQMGSPEGEGHVIERPRHWVKISKDYYIGETEISQAQWKVVMNDNPSYHDGEIVPNIPEIATPIGEIQMNRPVENITFKNICVDGGVYPICFQNAIQRLVPGNPTFQLPTEAQWEYAARGGDRWRMAEYLQWAGTDKKSELRNFAWYGNTYGGDS
ncbi:MAG: formylglycine-generating enzyme family protein, partial [Rikenellaceae bacterium]